MSTSTAPPEHLVKVIEEAIRTDLFPFATPADTTSRDTALVVAAAVDAAYELTPREGRPQ